MTRFSPTLIISPLLLATYLAQQQGDPLVFLPAGIQLLAGFVYGIRALPGCIVGLGLGTALLAHQPLHIDTLTAQAAYGTLSTLSLLGLIHAVCRVHHINHKLAGLGYRHILIVVVLQALSDALLRTALIPAPEHSTGFQLLTQATGNLLGSMTVVFTLLVLANLHQKRA